MTPPPFFTRRVDADLELGAWEEHHADDLYAVVDANRAHLRRWLPWLDGVKGPDDQRAFIRRSLEQAARNDGFSAGIWHRGTMVGGIGFHYVNWLHRKTEFGYWLAESAQGKAS